MTDLTIPNISAFSGSLTHIFDFFTPDSNNLNSEIEFVQYPTISGPWIIFGCDEASVFAVAPTNIGATNIVRFDEGGVYTVVGSGICINVIDHNKPVKIFCTQSATVLWNEDQVICEINNFPCKPSVGVIAFNETGEIKVNSAVYYEESLSGKKITLYGDSITVAFMSIFYECFISAITGMKVYRKGESGAYFSGNLSSESMLEDLILVDSDIVIIHSVNDHRANRPIGSKNSVSGDGTVIGGLMKIFEKIIENNPETKIYLCSPIPYAYLEPSPSSLMPNSGGLYLSDYTMEMVDLCTRYAVSFIDLSKNVQIRATLEETTDRVHTVDGVHPSEIGYFEMYKVIKREIEQLKSA